MIINIIYILIFFIFSYLVFVFIKAISRGMDAKNKKK